jgi:hypothetical protein
MSADTPETSGDELLVVLFIQLFLPPGGFLTVGYDLEEERCCEETDRCIVFVGEGCMEWSREHIRLLRSLSLSPKFLIA